jgi:hypothetical protein
MVALSEGDIAKIRRSICDFVDIEDDDAGVLFPDLRTLAPCSMQAEKISEWFVAMGGGLNTMGGGRFDRRSALFGKQLSTGGAISAKNLARRGVMPKNKFGAAILGFGVSVGRLGN